MKTSCSLSRRIGFTLPLLLLAVWPNELHAQPGSLDTSFNATSTIGQVDGYAHEGFSVAVQPDGKVIALGTFGVMRFLTDGSVDSAYQPIPPGPPPPFVGPGTGGTVVLQPDGRILVKGIFTNAAGMSLPNLFRLNADGSVDSSFNLEPGVPSSGNTLILQADGKVLTSGFIRRPGGEYALGLMRLRADGSLDPSFDSSSSITGDFSLVALAPDGRIYVYFAESGVVGRLNADGSRDESFHPEPDSTAPYALVVQHDGKVLVGSYINGSAPWRAVRRLLPDGTDDPGWTVQSMSGGDDSVVSSLLVQPDGKVLVGGANEVAILGSNGFYNQNLGRLNPDGSVDTTFDTGYDLHYYFVEDMALAPDGKIVVAGRQGNRPDMTAAPSIWRLNNDTGLQPQLNISFTMNEGVTLRLSGQSGATYRLEYREGLPGTGAWTPLTDLTLSGTSATWQDTTLQSVKTRFYRAVSLQ